MPMKPTLKNEEKVIRDIFAGTSLQLVLDISQANKTYQTICPYKNTKREGKDY